MQTEMTVVEEPQERLGFYLEGEWYWGFGASGGVFLSIGCVSYPQVVPQVVFDGIAGEIRYTSGFAWHSDGYPGGAVVPYSIRWKGDVLNGTVTIPSAIDSVFVNDSLITSRTHRLSESADSGYCFRWRAATGALFYILEMQLTLSSGDHPDAILVDTIVAEPRLTVPAEWADTFTVSEVDLSITPTSTHPIASGGMEPHVASERMYCYEKVLGPAFSVEVRAP